MTFIDIIILITIVVAFILGFKDGLIRKIIGLVGFVLAIILAIKLASFSGNILKGIFGFEEQFAKISGGVIIFLAIMVITAIIKRVVHPFDKVNNLINRIAGGATGSFQFLVFLSAVFYILNTFGFPSEETKKKSFSYIPVANIIPYIVDVLGGYSDDARKTLQNYIMESDSL